MASQHTCLDGKICFDDQRRDVDIDKQIRDAHDSVKIKKKEDETKRKHVLLSSQPAPKRCKTSNT